jgi:hypothetical protein
MSADGLNGADNAPRGFVSRPAGAALRAYCENVAPTDESSVMESFVRDCLLMIEAEVRQFHAFVMAHPTDPDAAGECIRHTTALMEAGMLFTASMTRMRSSVRSTTGGKHADRRARRTSEADDD